MFEELMRLPQGVGGRYTGIQMALSLLRNDFPWIYDSGMELIKILRSGVSGMEKNDAMQGFFELLDFSFESPLMRSALSSDRDTWMMFRELPIVIKHHFSKIFKDIDFKSNNIGNYSPFVKAGG